MLLRKLLNGRGSVWFIPVRHKYKRRWATYFKEKTPTRHALEHFDVYYKPVFGSKWPGMRAALLSKQKYSVILNNYSVKDKEVEIEFLSDGADNIIRRADRTPLSPGGHGTQSLPPEDLAGPRALHAAAAGSVLAAGEAPPREQQDPLLALEVEEARRLMDEDLYRFNPVTRVLSAGELRAKQELEYNVYQAENVHMEQIPPERQKFAKFLKVMAFDRGDITSFTPSSQTSGLLDYYILDGSSVLPVLALDIQPTDDVLDLCAAPGSKSFAILQTLLPKTLTCVEKSHSRYQRLRRTLHMAVPDSHFSDGKLEVFNIDAVRFLQERTRKARFDKVLVDVPCYTDRHVVTEEENNMFRPSRFEERFAIQAKQKSLLKSAVVACKPGGSVVYSTCTLSMPQNDGVVQAAINDLITEKGINLAVEDTSWIASKFVDTFDFYPQCRFGQLVIPSMTANFGPTYFCKLKRLS